MLFKVPSLGGDSTKLMEDVDSPVTMSPDDKRVAFIRVARRDEHYDRQTSMAPEKQNLRLPNRQMK